jgi:DNA-binding transcriptional MerR regulator
VEKQVVFYIDLYIEFFQYFAMLSNGNNRPVLQELGRAWRSVRHNKPCTIADLETLTGFSRAELNYYHETKLIPQLRKFTKSRKKRPLVYYSDESVFKALIVSDLKRADFKFSQIRRAIKNIEDREFRFDKETMVLTDGISIFHAAITDKQVVDILRHEGQMLLLLSFEDQIQKLQQIA